MKVPVPAYGVTPPVAVTVTVVVLLLQDITPAVADAAKGAGAAG